VSAPRLLDAYCCEGGAGRGYADAGFDVTGIDNRPQPRYPFTFIEADALEMLADREFLAGFDAIHASPPCRDHTPLTSVAGTDGSAWLLEATRGLLIASGKPWVIENVPGAPMRADLTLCGHMFGLRTRRHRWFEFSPSAGIIPPLPHVHRPGVKTATKRRRERWDQGWDVSVTGDVGVYVGPEALGVDWMTGNGLSQAIPPAYTRYVGEFLMDAVTLERAA
jgi:DNA (cytosine-5)-methyltransferase 1